MITISGQLIVGITIDDKTIRDFTVRPAIVRDSVEALEEMGADCSVARLRVAIESRQVTFAGIPREAHNADLIMDLSDKDYGALTAAIDAVEKKLLAQSAP